MKIRFAIVMLFLSGYALGKNQPKANNPMSPARPNTSTTPQIADHDTEQFDQAELKAWETERAQLRILFAEEKAAIDAINNDSKQSKTRARIAINLIKATYKDKAIKIILQARADRMMRRSELKPK